MAKVKYTEGFSYEFKYLKKTILEEEFLVFEDKYKDRFLIPAKNYLHYNLTQNQMVRCFVTRVDCSGKISFEPEHPYYKIGEDYEFNFVKMQLIEDYEYDPIAGKRKKTKDYEIIVRDRGGYEHSVLPHEWQKKKNFKADNIKCRLIRIVKGHFQLINLEEKKNPSIKFWKNKDGI